MNYQYNQPPQQSPQMPPPPPPVYVNPAEVKKKKKESFEKFADKMSEFCRSNPILAAISGVSDILSYIITGICVVMSIILMFMGSIYTVLSFAAILLGVLAVSKKTALPLAAALSGVALAKLWNLIFTIVFMASASQLAWYSGEAGRLATAYLLQIVFILLELAAIALPTVMAWQYFAATLPPKPAVPMYGGQMPQQPPVQNFQQPPAQNFQQPPAQNFQQPPAQNFQQPPVQNFQQPPADFPKTQSSEEPAPQPQVGGKQCPNCGKANAADSAFCFGCGTKL